MAEEEAKNVHAIVIPRNGPRSFPERNVYVLFGRPLVGWVLNALKLSRHVTGVFVSTNDEKVARITRDDGCDLIPRPAELDDDRAERVDIVRHAVTWLYKERNLDTDIVISVRATIPEIRSRHIDAAIEFLERHHLRELISVGANRIQNDHLRLIHRRALFSTSLSVGIGVFKADYVDVRSMDDVARLQAQYETRERFDAVRE